MFERFTEKARRVIFFARYEASQYGASEIQSEHILLGLLREDKALMHRFVPGAAADDIRKTIDFRTPIRGRVSTSTDMALNPESKRALACAAEEAERLSHKHIGTEHLFLGLLRESGSLAAVLLKERGVEIEAVRKVLGETAAVAGGTGAGAGSISGMRVPPPEVEFVCGEEELGHVYGGLVGTWHRLPQIGEQIVLAGRNYRVEDITSVFDSPSDSSNSVLAKVVIKLKEN